MKFSNRNKDAGAISPAAAPRPPKPPRARSAASSRNDTKGGRGAQKFVLFVGDEGAILVYMRGNTVLRRLFAASPQPDHTSAVLELLNAHPKVPLSVMCDVLDQQYVRHSFPPVSALSVNNLVKRRIERDFQASDLTGSIRLGREKTGRKEWQYLLVALAITPVLQQWFDLLVEQPNELKGIFLTPVEGQAFIPTLHKAITSEKPMSWQLLVSHHKVSGFRQIVLRDGRLAFTRVTQAIDDALPAVIAGNIEQEIMNTLEYLRRLGFTENNTLEMIVVAAQEVQETIDLKRFNAAQSYTLTPMDVADALHLEQAALSADRFGDVVMAAAFARAKKRHMKLLTAYGQKLSQLYAARLGLKLVGVLAVFALLGMSAANIVQAMGDNSAADEIEAKRKPLQDQLNTVRKSIVGLNKDVALKSAIMLTYDAYMKDVHPPSEFINELAPLLPPQARIAHFSWGPPGTAGNSQNNVPAGSAADGPLEVRIDFEFSREFPSLDVLSKFVEKSVAALKTGMPNYTILNLPYPWENKQQTGVEISFDQQSTASSAIKEGDNKVTLIFRGPKPAAGAAAAGSMPAGAAGMGGGSGMGGGPGMGAPGGANP